MSTTVCKCPECEQLVVVCEHLRVVPEGAVMVESLLPDAPILTTDLPDSDE